MPDGGTRHRNSDCVSTLTASITTTLINVTTDTMTPVSTQPLPSSMNAYSVGLGNDEKFTSQCHIHLSSEGQCPCAVDSNPARHRACHQARLRRLLLPIALLLLGVGATLVISCISDIDLLDLISLGADVTGSPLGKRQSTSSGQSSFTQNKREFISRYTIIAVAIAEGFVGRNSVSHCRFRRVGHCAYRGYHA